MARRLARTLERIKSASGRKLLLHGAFFRTWRVLFPVATAYRRILVRRPRIVAVVGTFGKTTAARAVHAALGVKRRQPQGWNSGAFLARELLRVRPGDRHGVLEVGISRKGTMRRCARLVRPDIVIVTSIGSEHHLFLGSLKEKRDEKAEMVRGLPRSGLAVLNGDDPHVLWMRHETPARVITFGLGEACDVRASGISLVRGEGMRFTLHAGGISYPVSSHLVGLPMVRSLLAAFAVAAAEGLPVPDVLERIQSLQPTPERLEMMPLAGGATLLIDTYKSHWETILASLDTLAALPGRRRIVVLGEVEDPEGCQWARYRELGSRLARVAARVVFVGKSKAYASVARGARVSGMPGPQIVHAGKSPQRAAELVREDLRAGDIVLIKGRGSQQLERVAFRLAGLPIECEVETCSLRTGCAACPTSGRKRPQGR